MSTKEKTDLGLGDASPTGKYEKHEPDFKTFINHYYLEIDLQGCPHRHQYSPSIICV